MGGSKPPSPQPVQMPAPTRDTAADLAAENQAAALEAARRGRASTILSSTDDTTAGNVGKQMKTVLGA